MKKFLLVITLLIFNVSCVEKTTEGNFNKQLDSVKIQSNNDENLENHEPEWTKIEIPNGWY